MNVRILFLCSFLCASLASSAQISLSQTDIASSGSRVIDQSTAFPSELPTVGANQTWDFLTVGDTLFSDTTFFLLPSATPFSSVMTGSNLASKLGSGYTYYEKSAAGFYLKGIAFELPPIGINLPFTAAPFNFMPKIPIVKFPGNYGQVNTGTGSGKFEFDFDTTVFGIHITKVRITLTVTLDDTINGWGTAQFPSGPMPCLRQSQSQRLSFAFEGRSALLPIWLPLPLNFPDQKNRSILFWANGKNAPVATIGVDTLGNITNTSFQRPLLTDVVHNVKSTEFEVYPNPARNTINWDENNRVKNLKLFSPGGQLVLNRDVLSTEKSINIESFPNGLYWLKAESEKGEARWKKLIINK